MRGYAAFAIAALLIVTMALDPTASAYLIDTTIPQAGGCPAANRRNLSLATPLNRRWSTSLPGATNALLTVAASGTPAQLAEIEQAITDSFGVWAGVTGTTFNATAHPGLFAPLGRVANANACTNDAEIDADGLNTICFNESSAAFSSGVLAFTRTITANAPGASVGSNGPAAFAGQILDADTLFRNDGQATFATPAALATTQGQGAYDLESLLTHELGHWMGFDHSAVWRAIMFPFAPPPGEFLGNRPTPTTTALGFACSTRIRRTPLTSAQFTGACCRRIRLRWLAYPHLLQVNPSPEFSARTLWRWMRRRDQ